MSRKKKDKKFQKDCREMVKSGKINTAEGKWADGNDAVFSYSHSMVEMMRAGYRTAR